MTVGARKNLDIELEEGTSVLNIAYRDTDQTLVLPVIRKISSDYQLYSGRDRSKSITNGLAFAEEQVEQFRQEAAKSSRELDAFSIRYGIDRSGKAVGSSGFDISRLLSSEVDISSISGLGTTSSISRGNKKASDSTSLQL